MGVSHLLQPKHIFNSHLFGYYLKESRAFCSTPLRKKRTRCSKEEKAMSVESYVKKYMEIHPGKFPKPSNVHSEVGGSWYFVKESFMKVKEKIMGNSQVQSHSNNGDYLNSAADATTSTDTTVKSLNNSSEKRLLDGLESSLVYDVSNGSDIAVRALKDISRRNLSKNITYNVAAEANMKYDSLENAETGKPRNLLQSPEVSTDSKGNDNNVTHATCSSTEKSSSANMFDSTACEVGRAPDSTDKTELPEAACKVSLSDMLPLPKSSSKETNFLAGAFSHLCGDLAKEGVSDSLDVVHSRKEQMEAKDIWNKKSNSEPFSGLMPEFSRTLQATNEYKRPLTGGRNQVESKATALSFVTKVKSELEERPSFNIETDLAMDEKSKSLELSSVLHEGTGTLRDTKEDKMTLTGCGNQAERKTKASTFKTNVDSGVGERHFIFDDKRKLVGLVDLFRKKVDEKPDVKHDEGHLKPDTLSDLLARSMPNQISKTSEEVIRSILASTVDGHNQQENQGTISRTLSKVASEGIVLPNSDAGAQEKAQSTEIWKNRMKGTGAGQMKTKCNSLPPNGFLEESKEKIGVNVATNLTINLLSDYIKKLTRGQQAVSSQESISSSRTEQNHTGERIRGLQSQDNMQRFGSEGKQLSSNHQNAKQSALRMRDLNRPQVALSTKAFQENKVLVRFLRSKAEVEDIVAAFGNFNNTFKAEISEVRHNFRTASLYFKTKEDMQKALQTVDLMVNGSIVVLETASSLEYLCTKIPIPNLIGDPSAPAALLKNPTRTVAIKQLSSEICIRHIEEALTFCESNISGIFLGSSSDVAYVEFESEDGKERALEKFSIEVLGKQLVIHRIDSPRTTVVRFRLSIPDMHAVVMPIVKSCGKIRASAYRSFGIWDVHLSIMDWPNMLAILNKFNGMQILGHQLIAEAAPVIPPDVLHVLYSHPDERRRIKADMIRLVQKLGENPIHKARINKFANKLYGEP